MPMPRVALGADHAGFLLKEHLKAALEARGFECEDLGTHSTGSVDYPDYAERVARSVAAGLTDRGILVCGSGTGMAIAANKVSGVRAAACSDPHTARLAREHNDANVLTLGARITGPGMAVEIAHTFLDTAFAGGRHERRLEKIGALERPGDLSRRQSSPHESSGDGAAGPEAPPGHDAARRP